MKASVSTETTPLENTTRRGGGYRDTLEDVGRSRATGHTTRPREAMQGARLTALDGTANRLGREQALGRQAGCAILFWGGGGGRACRSSRMGRNCHLDMTPCAMMCRLLV